MEKDGVIKSGSQSVNDLPAKDPDTKPVETKTSPEGPYLGSYKTREEAEKGLAEKERLIGEKGKELGALRTQNQELASAVSKLSQQMNSLKTNPQNDTPKGNDELEKVVKEFGQLDFYNDETVGSKAAELLQKAMLLTATTVKNDTISAATNQFKEVLNKRDSEGIQKAFRKQHPDFDDILATPEAQKVKEENPMHDDFSAYFAVKEAMKEGQISELQQALEEAKKISNLAGGDENAGRVFTKPGSTHGVRDPNKKLTAQERRESAFQKLAAFRNG